MTDGQYLWCCIGVTGAILLTAQALWRRHAADVADRLRWRSITRRARPEPWPFDWRVSCPEMRRPAHWRVLDQQRPRRENRS